ncbi:MAG: hypothetical protein NVS1B13_02970 [Flavisolibacter sp.]
MNDLEELIYQIKLCGLDFNQAEESLRIVSCWISDNYPVMGALTEIWLKENGFGNPQEPHMAKEE